METKRGVPASPGIVIREAYVLDTEEIHIPQRFIEKEQVEAEAARFAEGVRTAQKSLDKEMERMGGAIGINNQILEIHKMLLVDPVLRDEILEGIQEKQYTAEHAVVRVLNSYIKKFENMDSPIISERVHDLYDVEKLLIKTLLGHRLETMHKLDREVVVISHNMTPAETAKLDPTCVKGFATDVGGRTSHTAIMARAMGIPAVVALEDISTTVVAGETIIIDGFRGVVIVDPDDDTLEKYRVREANVRKVARRLRRDTRLPSETIDGYSVEIHANIEMAQEASTALELGATGVGLFRTEFVFLQKPHGGEEWHYSHYRKVVETLQGLPLTIRTLDLGGDKGMLAGGKVENEENPFLGCRSIRYCFAHPDLFRDQLRAILRASEGANVEIMLPMVTSGHEIDRAREFIAETQAALQEEGVSCATDLRLGVIMEVPSLALIADQIASRVDFFSVGTNDLVQYTLAVDRGNEHVAELYDPVHPAVLRLLTAILGAGDPASISVSICGEMASEPLYIPLLVGLGFRRLSVTPPMIPEVKRIVRSITVHEAQKLADRCLGMTDGTEIATVLAKWGEEHLHDIVNRW